MQICLSLALAATLAGCATTRTVEIPVPVACVREIPQRPELLAEKAWESGDVFERARALLVDRLRLLMHAERLEAMLEACKG